MTKMTYFFWSVPCLWSRVCADSVQDDNPLVACQLRFTGYVFSALPLTLLNFFWNQAILYDSQAIYVICL